MTRSLRDPCWNYKGSAVISADGIYRYSLTRGDTRGRTLHWCCLNPSTADADLNDMSVFKMMGFSERNGYNSFSLVNIFAHRARNPEDMKLATDPVGPNNRDYIDQVLERAIMSRELFICAWGNHGVCMNQGNTVAGWILASGISRRLVKCLGINKNGTPEHPLQVPYSRQLIEFPL